MLKKILIFVLLMLFSICYAAEIPKDKQAQYKLEVETYVSKELPEIKKRVDSAFWHARTMHDLYELYKYTVDKSKYADKLYDYINEIDAEELYFYLELVNITDKYVKIKNDMPTTDSPGVLYDFILPYLKQCKVNTKNITDIYYYTDEKTKIIYDYLNEI